MKMPLKVLPCLDSAEIATALRGKLDIPRDVAADLGRSAVAAIYSGGYISSTGQFVDWADPVHQACERKHSISADDRLPPSNGSAFAQTTVQVTNETTLSAAVRLTQDGSTVLALNFANGIYPGGGFLHGARAQEEYLCRSSALYATLAGDAMYDAHAARPQPDSTSWAIYSPDVPVFRDDEGSNLRAPWLLSFVTCAAPFAPSIGQPLSGDLLEERIRRVLAIARAHGHTRLVLGAWGCGAFHNDVNRTADDFRKALENEFAGAFSEIIFAIADWSAERRFLAPFRDAFASSSN